MTVPNNIAIPCADGRADALIVFRGFFNPQAVHLRFVTNNRVIDYVDEPIFRGGSRPSRPVDARALIRFLCAAKPTKTMVLLDRDLEGRWQRGRANLVYHLKGPRDPAMVFLTRNDAAKLASWMCDVAFGSIETPASD